MATVPDDVAAVLSALYFAPGGYMGVAALARQATERLGRRVGIPMARQWLQAQPVGQLYGSKPKETTAYFDVTQPNAVHVADLLELPTDRGGFKYALNVVDVASRFKASRPLKTKTAQATKNALQKIYEETPMDYPSRMLVDAGREFMGTFAQTLKEQGTTVRVAQRQYHRGQAPVESFNRALAIRLFKSQSRNELASGRTSREWVANLQPTVNALNRQKVSRINATPAAAMRAWVENGDRVALRRPPLQPEPGPPIKLGDRVRVALEDDPEDAPGGRRRATDPYWSPTVREVGSITHKESYPTLYWVSGLKHSLTRGRLLKV